MDALDLKILATLQTHSDLSAAQVGEMVGLSSTPFWRRIRKLEDAGVIRGKKVILDAEALRVSVNVFAEVRLKHHDEATLTTFDAQVRALPEVVECFSVSGDNDYVLRTMTTSIEAYEQFLKKSLLHLPAVAAVNSRFALSCVKLTTAIPLESTGTPQISRP